jgi:hypothetical protein
MVDPIGDRCSSHDMEVFYDNPDCKNEGEDLPYSGGYQTLVAQIILMCHLWEHIHGSQKG